MHIAQAVATAAGIFVGHTAVCVTLLNRIQGFGISHGHEKVLKRVLYLFAATMTVFIGVSFVASEGRILSNQHQLASTYFGLCGFWLVILAVFRPLQVLRDRCKSHWSLDSARVITVPSEHKEVWAGKTTFPHWPQFRWNQVLSIEVNQKRISIDGLSEALEGMTITHLSDFHLVGVPDKQYFQWIADEVNKLDSDLICVSGDIVDAPQCVKWLPDIFGAMHARSGKFFVLGNHDIRRLDKQELIASLEDLEMTWVGKNEVVINVSGEPVRICGTEMPWSDGNPIIDQSESAELSIAVMHSPDPVNWARAAGINLALAGHLHGGQIRLPLIGPVVSPSMHGVRMASGVFRRGSTMLHVSRGLSGLQPIRWRCRPEVTQLVMVRS